MNNLDAENIDIFLISEADFYNDTFIRVTQQEDYSFCPNLHFMKHVCDLQFDQPSIVFVDCHDNFNFLEAFNRQCAVNAFVVAIISDCETHKQQLFELGARDYITYPFIPAQLWIRLESIACLITRAPPHSISNTELRSQQAVIKLNKYTVLVDKTCYFLLENLAKDYSLEQLCSCMATNRNTLSKAFKQQLGMSVFGWLRLQRLAQAKILLEDTDYPIQEISASVGYEDPANFSTAFRSVYGMSPSQYRQLRVK